MIVQPKRTAFSRLKTHFASEGIGAGIWLALRFFYCSVYRLRFQKADSFFIRGPFIIRGARYISIGSLRGGNRITIDAIDRYRTQSFQPKLSIGKEVFFSNDIHIGCTHRIVLGNGVLLGSNVYITDHDHGIYAGEGLHSHPEEPPSQRPLTSSGTVILEDNVHVGEYVTILKNVRIGVGSIIGAHSSVTRDIPPYTIAAGNPARPLKKFCHATLRWITLAETR